MIFFAISFLEISYTFPNEHIQYNAGFTREFVNKYDAVDFKILDEISIVNSAQLFTHIMIDKHERSRFS